MNKYNLATGLILLCSLLNIAFGLDGKSSTQPTKASQPIPTVQQTHNLDVTLGEQAQAAIAKIPSLKGQPVSAASKDQVITLQGSVENKMQEQAAIKAAKSVRGVKDVKSQLTIKIMGDNKAD